MTTEDKQWHTSAMDFARRLLAPLSYPTVWLWLLITAFSSAGIFAKLAELTQGAISLTTAEQQQLSCVLRQLDSGLVPEAIVISIRACFPG